MKPNLDDLSLDELGDLRRELDKTIFERVQLYRDTGSTWANIGALLRVTASEAHRRYKMPKYDFPLTTDARASEKPTA